MCPTSSPSAVVILATAQGDAFVMVADFDVKVGPKCLCLQAKGWLPTLYPTHFVPYLCEGSNTPFLHPQPPTHPSFHPRGRLILQDGFQGGQGGSLGALEAEN